jgi:hypothetical protein
VDRRNAILERVACRFDAPAIGFYVADSDAAAIYFAGPSSSVGLLGIASIHAG